MRDRGELPDALCTQNLLHCGIPTPTAQTVTQTIAARPFNPQPHGPRSNQNCVISLRFSLNILIYF